MWGVWATTITLAIGLGLSAIVFASPKSAVSLFPFGCNYHYRARCSDLAKVFEARPIKSRSRCREERPLLRQFNREAFHAARQRYGETGHVRCVQMAASRTHLGPGVNHKRSDKKQRRNNHNGEYVAHTVPFSACRIGPIAPRAL